MIEVATQAQKALEAEGLPIQVAVMGCVVNGPERPGKLTSASPPGGGGATCLKGQVVRVVPEQEMVEALLDEARKLAAEGVEARLAAADVGAAAIAQETRKQLVEIQGDANRTAERRARVAQIAE